MRGVVKATEEMTLEWRGRTENILDDFRRQLLQHLRLLSPKDEWQHLTVQQGKGSLASCSNAGGDGAREVGAAVLDGPCDGATEGALVAEVSGHQKVKQR